jgi:hypothetical protein
MRSTRQLFTRQNHDVGFCAPLNLWTELLLRRSMNNPVIDIGDAIRAQGAVLIVSSARALTRPAITESFWTVRRLVKSLYLACSL